ncbi:hypothetical protein BDF20DRAFT_999755 [Mycotypha africana]|uniref:uncharacterized protein n=1 Tax=Mycotypha africana TaxID=64632 RepID=UPI0022FFC625|nr:uncharacterized protein BDF20DRAFT_999755 [Mycotypha africana]KAI8981625.1 hypothetical protein BDF20DRAFT_999755 [Mycotypha africana]
MKQPLKEACQLKTANPSVSMEEAVLFVDCYVKKEDKKAESGRLIVTPSDIRFHSNDVSASENNFVLPLNTITCVKCTGDEALNKPQNTISISAYTNDKEDFAVYIFLEDSGLEEAKSLVVKLNHIIHDSKSHNHLPVEELSQELRDLPAPTSNGYKALVNRADSELQKRLFDDKILSQQADELEANNPTTTLAKQALNSYGSFKPDPDTLPADIPTPDRPVNCNCDDHLDRQEVQLHLPISAKRCFELMFSDVETASLVTNSVWEDKTTAIEGHDLSISKWETIEGGRVQRILKYWMPVANPIVRMKEAEVVETQMLINKKDYICYTVQISTKTAALPYAEAFIPSVRYCITWVSESECKLTCYLGVRWVKNVLVKAIVTRAALKGMSDSVHIFTTIINDAAKRVKASVDELRLQNMEYNQNLQNKLSDGDKQQDDLQYTSYSSQFDLKRSSAILIQNQLKDAQLEGTYGKDKTHDVPTQKNDQKKEMIMATANVHSTNQTAASYTVQRFQPKEKSTLTLNDIKNAQLNESNINRNSKVKDGDNKRINVKYDDMVERQEYRLSCRRSQLKTRSSSNICLARFLTVIVLIILTSYMTFLWTKWSYTVVEDPAKIKSTTNARIHIDKVCQPHLVYLQDIKEGLMTKDGNRRFYIDSISHKSFLQFQKAKIIVSEEAYAPSSARSFQWFSDTHRKLSTELNARQETIAMLRYNALALLRTLNRLELDSFEAEYANWLLDMRLQCKYSFVVKNIQEQRNAILCEDIDRQIQMMFES